MSNFVNLLDIVYPVGSVYITFSDVSPVDSIGGSWEKIDGKFLQSSSEADAVNSSGGTSDLLSLHIGYAAYYRALVTTDNASADKGVIAFTGDSKNNSMQYEEHYKTSQWGHNGNSVLTNHINLKDKPSLVDKYIRWDNRPAYITCNMYRRTA